MTPVVLLTPLLTSLITPPNVFDNYLCIRVDYEFTLRNTSSQLPGVFKWLLWCKPKQSLHQTQRTWRRSAELGASDEEVSHAALSFWIRGILRPGRCLFRFLRMLLSSVCAVAVHIVPPGEPCRRGWGVCLVCSYKCQDPGFPRQIWYVGRLEHPSVNQNRPITAALLGWRMSPSIRPRTNPAALFLGISGLICRTFWT